MCIRDRSHEDLGGSVPHATKSGVAHFVYDDESQCINAVKKLLSFLPQNNLENAKKLMVIQVIQMVKYYEQLSLKNLLNLTML